MHSCPLIYGCTSEKKKKNLVTFDFELIVKKECSWIWYKIVQIKLLQISQIRVFLSLVVHVIDVTFQRA